MSRRKQARPSKLIDDEDEAQPVLNLTAKPDGDEEKVAEGSPSGVSSDGKDSDSDKQQEEVRRQRQDAENNNSVGGDDDPVPGVAGHVLLEALQNTKVAVAQIPTATRDEDAPGDFPEIASLQSTLFTLQHQQMMQISLIQQLQSHLTVGSKDEDDPARLTSTGVPMPAALPTQHSPKLSGQTSPEAPTKNGTSLSPSPALQSLAASQKHQPLTIPKPPQPVTVHPPQHPSMCSISSSLASSIITNNDPIPSLDEPNTLEMLQKRAQEVLDNASQGLLANNLADELAFRKNGKNSLSPLSGGRNEPFFKHRCRYCGKVFGSDSALQIHIRSHTGERPFKCNVCGSRFTTKGNLKVHFQRHSAKFPHIKMNPNPIPEHLDKFHPPLLAQMGNQGMSPGLPSHPGHHPHHQFPTSPPFPPGLPLFRPPLPHDLISRPPPILPPLRPHEASLLKPLLPVSMFAHREEQDMPADLSKPQYRSPKESRLSRSPSPIRLKQEPCDDIMRNDEEFNGRGGSDIADTADENSQSRRFSDAVKQEPIDADRRSENNDRISFDERSIGDRSDMRQDAENEEGKHLSERLDYSSHYDDCSNDSKYSDDEDMREQEDRAEGMRSGSRDQPENLSSKSPGVRSDSGQRLPPSMPFMSASSPVSSTSSYDIDPAKDPIIYNSLLPRPGSNDNSWESLIEVTKTSETHKLQQLVDNIEHKVTDPNQCLICHRVLSCKSALQMHYRTHTGERPFRCKICGRSFTTKGNLKTHMGVHRLKPPMRMLHQCPVCHKKFTNALVLQQHIRLHTGEPTDLTPEQIHAAEIKNFTNPAGYQQGANSTGYPLPFGGSQGDNDAKDDDLEYDDDDDNMSNSSISPHYQSYESQLRAVTDLSAEDLSVRSPPPSEVNGRESPASPRSQGASPSPSPRQISPAPTARVASPSPSESNSQGALDLTPKASITPSPRRSPGPPPVSFFSGLGMLSPIGPSPLMTSALSSLTSSVITSTTFSPLGMAMGPTVRGNTTCNICFKTFACYSALEIHYRSHTKERPFKCTICDRGFSTKGDCGCRHPWRIKRSPEWGEARLPLSMRAGVFSRRYATGWPSAGNMKQHMMTHKIRDMPPHLFDNKRVGGAPPPSSDEVTSDSNMSGAGSTTQTTVEEPPSPVKMETPPPPPPPPQLMASKRSPPEGDLPLSKRPPTMPKHLCQVCNKNFSSSSALQIHMRTHTGDKPFRCTVCQKAFTTKGNLKVHMGTHMWSNGASRRGRRMSLDLPPIPLNPKDSEFLQRRPDLFYPYLPSPFLNGVHHKLSEMSSLHGGHLGNGLHPSSKYSGLLGFGGFNSMDKASSDSTVSPPLALSMNSRRGSPPTRVGDELPRGVWDMHFDRKSDHSDDRMDVSSPNRLPAREGLAA